MNVFPRIPGTRFRRRLSAAVGLLALVVQLAVPVLHGRDAVAGAQVAHAGEAAVEIRSADGAAHASVPHDDTRCSQCRVVSQARTLSAPLLAVGPSPLRTDWIDLASCLHVPAQDDLESAAPRGPPSIS